MIEIALATTQTLKRLCRSEGEKGSEPMKTQVLCAYAVDLNTERLTLLRFGGFFQQRDNISRHLDDCIFHVR